MSPSPSSRFSERFQLARYYVSIAVLLTALHCVLCENTELYSLSKDPNDIHFYLFPVSGDPQLKQEIKFNDSTTLTQSLFQCGHKTVFIVHGFRSNVSSDMPQTVKNAYLNSGLNYNYIVVDWGALSTPLPPPLTASLYTLVTFNVPIVAQRVAEFIGWIRSINGCITIGDTHMVGHSLGSHVSGLTGKNLNDKFGEKLARITGLDPAGPLFFPPISSRNLVKTDATFVDVIHTNAGTLGDVTNDGHADFWPNGGSTQPGCALNDTGIPGGSPDLFGRCSHWFSYQLYAASFRKDFLACKCDLFVYLGPSLCISCPERVLLGLNCPTTANGQYSLTTGNPP